MIISFRHKGLEEFFKTDHSKKINPNHFKKLRLILGVLNQLKCEDDILVFQQWRPHKLKGINSRGQNVEGHWSLTVSGNWRVTYFMTVSGDVVLTDYIDYH